MSQDEDEILPVARTGSRASLWCRDEVSHPIAQAVFQATASPPISACRPSVGPSGRLVAGQVPGISFASTPAVASVEPSGQPTENQVPGLSELRRDHLDSSFSAALSERHDSPQLIRDRPGTAPSGDSHQQAANGASSWSTAGFVSARSSQRHQSVPPTGGEPLTAASSCQGSKDGDGARRRRTHTGVGTRPTPGAPAHGDQAVGGPVKPMRGRKIMCKSQTSALIRLQGQQKRIEDRARNPFVEYDDKEQKMKQERRWLESDPEYLQKRTNHLRQSEIHRWLAEGTAGARTLSRKATRDLNDDVVCIGSQSLQLKSLRKDGSGKSAKRPSSAPGGLGAPGGGPMPPPQVSTALVRPVRSARSVGPLRSMKKMQRDLAQSSRKLELFALH